MKNPNSFIVLMCLACAGGVWAQGTTFTYQGRLMDGTSPASGTYDLRFVLYGVESGGTEIGPTRTTNIAVTLGSFTIALDFGVGIFDGSARWLEVGVRTNGSASTYQPLLPRQPLTPTPYATYASRAGLALGFTGNNAVAFANPANSFSGAFSGNGSNLSNVNAFTFGGLTTNAFWRLSGNTVGPAHFLGSLNNQAVEIKVQGQRALRLEPATNAFGYGFGPNLIAGHPSNSVAPGFIGSTIAGGGRDGLSHTITAHHGTIGGGDRNTVNAENGTVAGGGGNVVQSTYSFIGGGLFNTIGSNIAYGACSAIGGGSGNFIDREAITASIAGGGGNRIAAGNNSGFIGGGSGNDIQTNSPYAVIGGGFLNTIRSNASSAAIVGGQSHTISAAIYGFIGGGWRNDIQPNANYGIIGGGLQNTIRTGAFNAAVVSGQENTNAAAGAFLGGGWRNHIQSEAYNSVIVGGDNNTMAAFANQSVIAGGIRNSNAAALAVIGGGENNFAGSSYTTIGGGRSHAASGQFATVAGGSFNQCGGWAATISGGHNNFANGLYSVVGGGSFNSSPGSYATIPGGFNNVAGGTYGFAAGRLAHCAHDGTFVWAGGATNFYTTQTSNSFNVYAQSGVSFDYAGQRADGRGNRWVYMGLASAGNTLVAWNGARLSDSGIWTSVSDKNRKTDFAEVDPRTILDRLANVPIRSWRYTNESSAIAHLGPTAQDFKAAFGFGDDDKSIGMVDADGVALAAIQGLNQKVETENGSLRRELKAKDAELQSLKKRLADLERLVRRITANRD